VTEAFPTEGIPTLMYWWGIHGQTTQTAMSAVA